MRSLLTSIRASDKLVNILQWVICLAYCCPGDQDGSTAAQHLDGREALEMLKEEL